MYRRGDQQKKQCKDEIYQYLSFEFVFFHMALELPLLEYVLMCYIWWRYFCATYGGDIFINLKNSKWWWPSGSAEWGSGSRTTHPYPLWTVNKFSMVKVCPVLWTYNGLLESTWWSTVCVKGGIWRSNGVDSTNLYTELALLTPQVLL